MKPTKPKAGFIRRKIKIQACAHAKGTKVIGEVDAPRFSASYKRMS